MRDRHGGAGSATDGAWLVTAQQRAGRPVGWWRAAVAKADAVMVALRAGCHSATNVTMSGQLEAGQGGSSPHEPPLVPSNHRSITSLHSSAQSVNDIRQHIP